MGDVGHPGWCPRARRSCVRSRKDRWAPGLQQVCPLRPPTNSYPREACRPWGLLLAACDLALSPVIRGQREERTAGGRSWRLSVIQGWRPRDSLPPRQDQLLPPAVLPSQQAPARVRSKTRAWRVPRTRLTGQGELGNRQQKPLLHRRETSSSKS